MDTQVPIPLQNKSEFLVMKTQMLKMSNNFAYS